MLSYTTLLSPNANDDAPLISEIMVVAAVFPERNDIWLLPYITQGENKTRSPDRKPIVFDLSEIESALESGELVDNQLQLEPYKDVPEEALYDEKKGKLIPSALERNRRYNIVKKALNDEEELFYPSHGRGVIAKTAKSFGVTRHNVQRYLNEYFRGGRHINSLIPKTGRHSSSPKPGAKKIGAPRNTALVGTIGKNVEPQDIENMRAVGLKYYVTKKIKSLKACHVKLLDEHYYSVKGKVLPDGSYTETKHLPPNERISENQFYYWLPKALGMCRNEINAKRRQSATHKSNFAGRSGDVAYFAHGPGHIFQMDSTEMDIEIVSPYDRRVWLRKVTLYVVRDVYTRAIVGIHIASGKASWYEARLALLNTFRDKTIVAKEWGLTIKEDDWIEGGIPMLLLVDNEELANKISSSVGHDLGLKVLFGRAYAGDDKGLVESSFHMLHAMMRNEELAGFQYKGLIGRNRQLPRKTAALTPRDIQQILIIYAIYHNNCVWKDDYPMEQEAARAGIKSVCRDYWNWGLKNRDYYLTEKPFRTLYLSMLEVGELVVHRTHLSLAGTSLRYRSDDPIVQRIQDRKGGRGKHPRLRCRYIRSTVDVIFIEIGGKLVKGELHSNQQRFQGLSHADFVVAWKQYRCQRDMHNHEILSKTSATSMLIGHINKEAIKTRDAFIEAQDEPPTLDTMTATQQQVAESYLIDNEMMSRLTEGDDNTAHIEPIEKVIEQAHDTDEQEKVVEVKKSVNPLNHILSEMNHG